MTRTVGIVTAVPQEFARLAEWAGGSPEADGPVSGVIDDVPVAIAVSGIGKVNAAAAATRLIERFAPGVLAFSGVAGGLDPALSVGDVVIGTRCIQHDAGVLGPEGFEAYQAGHIPFFNPTEDFGFEPSPPLLERCRRRLDGLALPAFLEDREAARIVFGTIVTSDAFVASEAERERLHSTFGAHAVDMESAAVAQVAHLTGIDHLAVRSLSDLAGAESSIDFARFLDHVADTSATTLRHLLPTIAPPN